MKRGPELHFIFQFPSESDWDLSASLEYSLMQRDVHNDYADKKAEKTEENKVFQYTMLFCSRKRVIFVE